jgi:hypothetical protein
MVKRIIKLKKRPRGKPPDPISKIAGTADRKAIRVIKKKTEKNKPNDTKDKTGQEGLRNPQGYLEFIYWLATPIDLREVKTQGDFANKIGVGQDVLSDWKKREGFQDLLMDTIKSNFRERSASVLRAVERRAHASGGTQDAALFFKATGFIKDGTELKLGIDDELKNALDKVAKALPD